MDRDRAYDSDDKDKDNHTWPYLLGGYVVGFLAVHLLVQRVAPNGKVGAFLSGFGVALSGGSLGKPWLS
jgi:hypothetical protein